MTWGKFKAGIDILDKYNKAEDYAVCAQHDILYAAPDASVVSDEDKAALLSLGWFIEDESWACFT